MNSDKKKIWMIIDHPWQLFVAMPIRLAYPGQEEFHLLVSRHAHWKQVCLDEYLPHFNSISFFDRPHHVRALREVSQFFQLVKRVRNEVKKLPVNAQDVFLIFSYTNYVENIITGVFPKNKRIFVCRGDLYESLSKTFFEILFSTNFHLSKSGLLHYFLLDPFAGLKKRVLWYWLPGSISNHTIVYSQKLDQLYDRIFVLRSIFTEGLKDHELYFPYILLKNSVLKTIAAGRKRVVFFLSGYPKGYPKDENYYKKTNRILRVLKELYGEKCLLEIRCHLSYPEEYKCEGLDCSGWVINAEPGNSEQYFVRHRDEIVGAFGHISSSVNFALNFGLSAYSYHRCMNYDKEYVTLLEDLFQNPPQEFFMPSFDALPQPYQKKSVSKEEIRSSLDKLYEAINA